MSRGRPTARSDFINHQVSAMACMAHMEAAMSSPLAAKNPFGHAVAVTAIEHGEIIITVASMIREARFSQDAGAECLFVTTIFGGPLSGATWTGENWNAMLRNHAGAVSRVAEFITAVHRSPSPDGAY
jgi:hypothetical protein